MIESKNERERDPYEESFTAGEDNRSWLYFSMDKEEGEK